MAAVDEQAGAGDELQGIKRGIMEMADALIINKADGDNITASKRAMSEYKSALHLFPPSESGWVPVVSTCSALEGTGISDFWEIVMKYERMSKGSGYWDKNRTRQNLEWMEGAFVRELLRSIESNQSLSGSVQKTKEQYLSGEIGLYRGFNNLVREI